MTAEQINLVKRSWRLFRQIDPQLLGGVFYDKLFTDQPSLRRLFKTAMEAQSRKLVDMLSAMVMHLDDPDAFGNEMEALAIRHVKYGIRPEHYQAVGSALLWTLQQGLGIDWTEEMEDAWRTCFEQLAGRMMAAAYEP